MGKKLNAISIRVNDNQLERVGALAEKLGTTKSNAVRKTLDWAYIRIGLDAVSASIGTMENDTSQKFTESDTSKK